MAEPAVSSGTAVPVVRPSAVYVFTCEVRPLRGEVTLPNLERLSLYNALYGTLLIAAGIAALLFPYAFFFTIEVSLGWILLACGISSLLHTLFLFGAPGTFSLLLLGLLRSCVGLWLLSESAHLQIAGIVLLLAGWFLAEGVVKMVLTIALRHISGWPFLLLSSLLSLAFGVSVLSLFPSSASEQWLAVFVSADLIVAGVGLVLVAVMASFAVQLASEESIPLLQQQQPLTAPPSAPLASAPVPAQQGYTRG